MNYLIVLIIINFIPFISFSKEKPCPPGQYYVREHFRRGHVRSDGAVVRPTSVNAHCKARSQEYEYVAPRLKDPLPDNWPHKKETGSKWIESEKERLIEALEEIPDILRNDHIKGLYRSKKSKDYPNPATSAEGIIVFYDSAFESSHNLGRITAHELSHQNYRDLKESEKQDYRRALRWTAELEGRDYYLVGRKAGYVEEDGKISPDEDYANNMEYYLYDPDKLKKTTPEAYSWIKNKYGEKLKLKKGAK